MSGFEQAAQPPSSEDIDFLYYVVYRDNATQTCPRCDLKLSQACVCQPQDATLDQPSALIYLRDASGAILAVAVMATLDVGGRVIQGAIYAATNASIGLVIAGIRGALAGIATGIFWTGISLLQFSIASTIALGTVAAGAITGRGSSTAASTQPEAELRVEEVASRQRCTTATQTDGVYLPTMANGIPVAVLPTMQQSLYASMMTSVEPDQPPASVSAPAPAPVHPPQRQAQAAFTAGVEKSSVKPSAPPLLS